MKLRCIFGLHNWKLIDWEKFRIYPDTISATKFKVKIIKKFKCEHCNAEKRKEVML